MRIERCRNLVPAAGSTDAQRFAGPPASLRAPTVVGVGNFDGVHLGHRRALGMARREAVARDAELVVVTFDPHPARLLRPEQAPGAIMTLERKAERLASLGVRRLVVLEFNPSLAKVSPAEFVGRLLVARLGVVAVVQGRNFRFGRHRSGNLPTLRDLGKRHRFAVIEAPTVTFAGEVVSSTRIRQALADRDLDLARTMLGHPYEFEGQVIPGRGRGRGLGFPTANLLPKGEVLLPVGVYAADAEVLSPAEPRRFRAVIHHGPRPTFGDTESLEAHLVGYSGAPDSVRLRPDRFLRPIVAFPTPEALRNQLERDVAQTVNPLALLSRQDPTLARAALAGS